MLRDLTPADGVPRLLRIRPAPAQAVALARAVTPLVNAALALARECERCTRWAVPDRAAAAPPFLLFADQLVASAQLLAECVRRTGRVVRSRRGDAIAMSVDSDARAAMADTLPAADADPETRRDAVRRLLDAEHAFARGVRRAIAACDAQADDRTAECLEQVLDEVRHQQLALAAVLTTDD